MEDFFTFKIREKEAKDFFLYSYFGIVTENFSIGNRSVQADTRESAAVKCAYRAYLDLCRTLTYKTEEESSKGTFVKDICTRLAYALCTDEKLPVRRKNAYEVFYSKDGSLEKALAQHLDIDDCIDEGKRHSKCFYFGQAQKWINMTVKYMWLIGIIGEADEESFDAPIDSIVMKAAGSDFSLNFPRNNKTYNSMFAECDAKAFDLWKEYSPSTSMPWSKLEEKEYERIQNCIRSKTGNNPLNWECNAWISQSVLDAIDDGDWRFIANKKESGEL
ncbi:MAG: hypothetical protein IJM18_07725 [Clostridia bacterium]|nr:hypothetical protein [Clostridia bacterium]